jgi:uncharacterized membrane-anchored protein YhcB (DUF1043 family)
MNDYLIYIIAGLTLLVGIGLGYYISKVQANARQRRQKETGDKIIQEAKDQARTVELKARDDALKIRINPGG